MENIFMTIAFWAIPAILAITLHEAAHGFVAKRCGDNTAWLLGRVTINPVKHIDPVGTLLVPGLLLLGSMISGTSGLLFGWAKPVPINVRRLRNPRNDMIWVSLAGPASNLIQALLWALLAKLASWFAPSQVLFEFILEFAFAGISVNLMLMAFNLLPILPLDGGRILSCLLPSRWAWQFSRLEPYGMFILIALIATGMMGVLVGPLVSIGQSLVGLVLSI
jgi:Zn-dependent protease